MAATRLAKVLFVINPISGDIEKDGIKAEIDDYCAANNLDPEFFHTTGENDLENLKEELVRTSYKYVVAIGGDGTVHLAGAALINTEIPLAILPMGSGNGLSKDVGIPQNIPEALELLSNHRIVAIDTLFVNDEVCVHLTDLGFNALVVKLYDEGNSRGASSYAFVAMQQYLSYDPNNYIIETDNGNFCGSAFMITITNANAFGSNAAINPSGIIDDGKFEICIIEPFPKASGLQILYRLYNDSIEASDYTQLISSRSAVIYNKENAVTQVDGEPIDLEKKISIKINPKSLKLIVPKL